VARCQGHDLLTSISEKYVVSNKESVGPLSYKGRKRSIQVTFSTCIKDTQLLSNGSSGRLNVSPLKVVIGIGRIQKHGDNSSLGNQFAQ